MSLAPDFRDASDYDIRIHVIDPWLIAAQRPDGWDALSATERAIVCLDSLLVQCSRNGIDSFVLEDPTWVVALVARAAEALGEPRVGELWERATRGMDLDAVHGSFHPVTWSDPRAATLLEDELVRMSGEIGDLGTRLVAKAREHALSRPSA